MTQYVAFLRGVSSGRNSTVKMGDLKLAFETLGYQHVRTVLASGNVLFEADEQEASLIERLAPRRLI
jgi:uncharacterized protein (DUF1697 family)